MSTVFAFKGNTLGNVIRRATATAFSTATDVLTVGDLQTYNNFCNDYKASVKAATPGTTIQSTTGASAAVWAAGVSASLFNGSATYYPDTITLTVASAASISVDGISCAFGDRILIKDESTASNNGIYKITSPTSGSATTFVLTRADDFSVTPTGTTIVPGICGNGAQVYVSQGTINGNTAWVVSNPTGEAITFGNSSPTNITFALFNRTSNFTNITYNTITYATGAQSLNTSSTTYIGHRFATGSTTLTITTGTTTDGKNLYFYMGGSSGSAVLSFGAGPNNVFVDANGSDVTSITLNPGQGLTMVYDATNQRWRPEYAGYY